MTVTIKALNVNVALTEGFWHLKTSGVRENSRNGPVIVAPTPVVTEYAHPTERVLFNPVRDANPVFHLMEAIWMIAGRDNVEFLLPFNANFKQYAEDDGVVHGAYGARWRYVLDIDQLHAIVRVLKGNPESRQAVMQMWDAKLDLGQKKRDLPCNTTIYFDCREGRLNMTVCCRSNDILWGAYGANAVHMSVLQEVVAAGVGVPVGLYRQFSNNFHAYTENEQAAEFLRRPSAGYQNPYTPGYVWPMPLVAPHEDYRDFVQDCEELTGLHETEDREVLFQTDFFNLIAEPLRRMYLARKLEGMKFTREEIMSSCPCNDWLAAFADWTARRDTK